MLILFLLLKREGQERLGGGGERAARNGSLSQDTQEQQVHQAGARRQGLQLHLLHAWQNLEDLDYHWLLSNSVSRNLIRSVE